MGQRIHFFHSVTREQRRRASANGCRSKHGPSVVYLADSTPVVLQQLARSTGLSVELLGQRVSSARSRGQSITLEWLSRPSRQAKTVSR